MPFVLHHNTLGANVDLIIFAEEFSTFVRMFETVLFGGLLLLLHLLFLLLG